MSLFTTLFSTVGSKRFSQLVVAAATVFIGSGAHAVVTTLSHNQQVSNLSGGPGNEKHFKIIVPASKAQVMFLMSGGSGDADMYISKGAQASTFSWGYRPYLVSTTEKVVVNNPSADGDWYFIMIKGYTSFSGIDFVAQFQAGPRLYRNGGTVRNIAGTHKEQCHFRIEVPLNATKLLIKTAGGTGDVDLYANAYYIPTTSVHSHESAHNGNTESIVINNPSSGTWYFMLRGSGGYSGVKLFAEYDGRAKYRMNSVGVKDQRPGVNFTSLANYSWRYGNWGGPFWMNAKEQTRATWNGSTAAFTVDEMDELFKQHDVAVKNANGNDNSIQQAEQDLEDGLNDLPGGAHGVNHSFWGPIYVSNSSDVPANVKVYPGSPYALPQVLIAPKLMPFSEYARRQALRGLNAGWLTE